MPVKKDASGRRWVELEFLVPGTPEQVWQAIATGPGMSAWFTPTIVDERVGGAITFDFGNDTPSLGTVTAWEPPFLFAYEEKDWSGEAPPVATEVIVTSRSGDRCVVRIVHSLFTSRDDWDNELEGFEAGWPGFVEVLRVYLANFPGKPAAGVRATATRPDGDLEVWSMMTAALNLTGANVGERREAPASAPRLAGVIERVQQDKNSRELTIRLEQPSDGIALIGSHMWDRKARGAISIYFYGADAQNTADAVRDEWASWLSNLWKGDRNSLVERK